MTAYRDPKSAPHDTGLIAALMRAPTSANARPEENQFSEALAWVLRCVPGLARDFALRFVEGDAAAQEAVEGAVSVRVDTRLMVRGPSEEVLYPDLSLCGSDRSFQLFVEVKVGAPFEEKYQLPDGSVVPQPVIYAHALDADPPGVGAYVRKVGTLSKDPGKAPEGEHARRCRDVSWSEVRDLLVATTAPIKYELILDDLVRAIDSRILPVPPSPKEVESLLGWGRGLLPGVLVALASIVGGTTAGRVEPGKAHPYVGGFADYVGPGGEPLRMWIYVSPANAGYSLPGEADAVYLQPDQGTPAKDSFRHPFAPGFDRERDILGYDAWRCRIPVSEVRAAGGASSEEDIVVGAFRTALSEAGLC